MANSTSTASNIILALIVETVGLGVVVVVAGISDDAGTTMVTLMFGLWLLFLIEHENVQSWATGLLGRVQTTLNG